MLKFKRNWLKTSVLLAITLVLLSFTFFKRQALACESIAYLGFEEASDNIFFDDTVSYAERTKLFETIEKATHRVTHVYGKPNVKPRYIISNNRALAQYGINMTGMHSKAFTNECIFLGPKGQNVDVAAHELVHAEVSSRVSEFTIVTQLPIWFIEAVAIKVDYRPPFLLENIELSPAEVESIKHVFFNRDFENTNIKNYQAARLAAESINSKKLYANLEKLSKGEPFSKIFDEAK